MAVGITIQFLCKFDVRKFLYMQCALLSTLYSNRYLPNTYIIAHRISFRNFAQKD